MDRERIGEIETDYKAALERLKEALDEDLSKGSIILDGVIQRFEFTFELAWKLAKAILNFQGMQVSLPRMVIKEAYKAGLIDDGQGWIDMLEDRNQTSHIYKEDQAKEIYEKIRIKHYKRLKQFSNAAGKY